LDRVASGNGNGSGHRTPAQVEAESRGRIASTPIAKLDGADGFDGRYATPLARIPRVDELECVGCNLCALVCPVDECITMEQVDTGLAPETWAQRIAALDKGGRC